MSLTTNGRFLLGKSKEWVGCSMQWMTALIESNNWEEIVWRYHAHGGTKFSIGSCIPNKYMNQGKPSGSSFHQKSFPYRPNHFSLTTNLGSHGLGPWVTKIIPRFAGNLNIHLGFPMCQLRSFSQSFKRSHLGPWCWFFLLHVLYSNQVWVLFFFNYYYYYYYFFLFRSFWDFGPSWSFFTSWIWHFFC